MYSSAPRHSLTARLIAWAAMALFAVRAIMPAGFMLDVKALASERYSIVICSPEGLKTITLDADGVPLKNQDRPAKEHTKASTHCPFATVVAKMLPPPDPQPLLLPQQSDAAVAWRIATLELPPILAGPPAGARAPPSLPLTTT